MSILDGACSSLMDNTVTTEIQYGLAVCNNVCLITPYAGFEFAVDEPIKSRLGTRVSIGILLNLEYEHTQNPSSDETTSQRVQLNSKINW